MNGQTVEGEGGGLEKLGVLATECSELGYRLRVEMIPDDGEFSGWRIGLGRTDIIPDPKGYYSTLDLAVNAALGVINDEVEISDSPRVLVRNGGNGK